MRQYDEMLVDMTQQPFFDCLKFLSYSPMEITAIINLKEACEYALNR